MIALSKKAAMTEFGKKVKIRLIEKDMTQTELASLLGIRKQNLRSILVGERPGKKYVKEIIRILEIDTAA